MLNEVLERKRKKLNSLRCCTKVKVSDHAMVRCQERKLGLELDRIFREIATSYYLSLYIKLGNGEFSIAKMVHCKKKKTHQF